MKTMILALAVTLTAASGVALANEGSPAAEAMLPTAVPAMVRLESFRSVHSLVSKYIRDERLRQVFTFEPLLVGGNPFRTTSIYLLIHWLERRWGVYYAKGGTGSIVDALTRLLSELGVDIQLNRVIERIIVSSSATVARCGNNSDTHNPLAPRWRNSQSGRRRRPI